MREHTSRRDAQRIGGRSAGRGRGQARGISAALLPALASCSLGMRGPDPAWDHKQKPECSDSYRAVFVDGLTAITIATAAVNTTVDEQVQTPPELVIAAAGVALLYTVSAQVGADRYRACRNATAEWHALEAIRQRDAKAAAARARTAAAGALGAPPPKAAFYCNLPSNAALEICVKERAVCEHARADSDDCAARDTAWCFGVDKAARCFATRPACEALLARISAISSACTERHWRSERTEQ